MCPCSSVRPAHLVSYRTAYSRAVPIPTCGLSLPRVAIVRGGRNARKAVTVYLKKGAVLCARV